MKIRNESINKNYLTPSIIFTLGIATVFGIGIYNATNIANTSNASALSYSTSKDISFTFTPTLSIGLSTDSLTIDNLAPGTTSDSNSVRVTVSSNTPYGYVLSAGVGNTDDTTSPYYNTSDLVHDNTTTEVPTTNKFSSIATSASLQTLDTDNTWGYSTSTDGGANWSTYSGLSHAETKPLLDISDPATPSTIDFKIAARSSSTQASGTYNNVITFYAVGKPEPMTLNNVMADSGARKTEQGYYRIQDVTKEICSTVDVIHSTLQVQDVRDNKIYTIAKLKDGKCWMTEDLNLAGGTEITSELSDVPENYILPTANGFQSGNKLPESVKQFNTNSRAHVFNTNNNTSDCSTPGCYGYYSWIAATAGSGVNITSYNADAQYSICPKGWKLPTSRTSVDPKSDFYQLAVAYGMSSSVISQSTPIFYNQAGPGTVPNFLMTGYYYSGATFGSGNGSGSYWSSTSYNRSNALFINISDTAVQTGNNKDRYRGRSIRCLVRQTE